MTGAFLKASACVEDTHAEALESLLNGQGALAVTLTGQGDASVLEPGVDETPLWGEVRVTGLFPADTDTGALARVISLVPGVESGSVRFDEIADRKWESVWMERFHPMQFGERLWIVPTGRQCPVEDAIEIRLDPGLAFGTGTHESTRLCLEWIDAHTFKGETVLDYGCGSGVLGIAAALKGARRILCIDNDPQAVRSTRENARRNAVEDRLTAMAPEPGEPVPANVVIANILASVLMDLAPTLVAQLAPGGHLVLAGILEDQGAVVQAEFKRFQVDLHAASRKNGWVLLCGKKS